MMYNTLNFTKSRFDPFRSENEIRFLTPGDQTFFANNFRMRADTIDVSWDGGKTMEPFTQSSMIDIHFYLSNNKTKLRFVL
jgi:hypothetical protein